MVMETLHSTTSKVLTLTLADPRQSDGPHVATQLRKKMRAKDCATTTLAPAGPGTALLVTGA